MEEIRLIRWYGEFLIIYKLFYTSPVVSRISSINSMEYNMYICKYTYCTQLKTCCRIGGWNHHIGHSTQRSAIAFWRLASWQGKCTRHGFPLRSTCIWRKLVSNTKSGPKNRVNFRTYNLLPRLLRAGFGGYETGLATQPFFLRLPYWGSIFGQHGRSCNDSLCARPASPPKGLLAQSFLAQS